MANFFKYARDQTDGLANDKEHFIDIYHVITEKSIKFKAFLQEFSDNFDPSWNDEEVFGRMDDLSTFKRTKRKISIKFDVIAASGEEAIVNHQEVSILASMFYPAYEDQSGGASTIIGSPLFKVKFLNLIHNVNSVGSDAKTAGLLVKIKGFTYSPNFEAGVYDIVFNKISSIFPKHYVISLEMDVYHTHKLGFTKTGSPRIKNFEQFPYSAFPSNQFEIDQFKRKQEESIAERNLRLAQLKLLLGR